VTLRAVEPVRLTIPPQEGWLALGVQPWCQHPFCESSYWLEGHHVVRRSETGGPKDWVSIDGIVCFNRVSLCKEHHDEITGGVGGHRARIRFPTVEELERGLYSRWWVWYAAVRPASGGPLQFRPLGHLDRPSEGGNE
jgi:hypothetical protein